MEAAKRTERYGSIEVTGIEAPPMSLIPSNPLSSASDDSVLYPFMPTMVALEIVLKILDCYGFCWAFDMEGASSSVRPPLRVDHFPAFELNMESMPAAWTASEELHDAHSSKEKRATATYKRSFGMT